MDSILTSIKKLLGISEAYDHFDTDLIMHINSVFSILNQLGVGPSSGFVITGKDETWNQFTEDRTELEQVKSYIYMKVRLLFDPPASSVVMDSINRMIGEFEWRLNVAAESAETGEEV
jgi:hypothetical protein